MLRFASPTEADVTELGDAMRLADREELAACGIYDAHEAARHGAAFSAMCWAAHDDTGLLCIFGVAPVAERVDIGAPWLLGTFRLFGSTQRRSLVVDSRAYIALMLERFPTLINFVHAKNTRSVRWLASLGFALAPAAPYGPHDELFHMFKKQRDVPATHP